MRPRIISLIVFLLVFVSNDTFFFGTNSNELILSIPRYGAIIISIFICFYKSNMKNYYRMFIPLILLLSFYTFSSVSNNDTITYIGIYFAYIVLAFLIATRIKAQDFWFNFDKIIYFLCKVGIICTIIAYIFPSIINAFPKVLNTAGVPISNLIICGFDSRSLGSSLIRCFSIFWEPGVFQIYISLALAYQLFYIQTKNTKRLIIYFIAIIVTFSTAGYFVLAYLLIIYFCFSPKRGKFNIKLFAIVLFALILLLTFGYNYILSTVFAKMQGGGDTTAIARYSSFYSSIQIAIDNPLTGVGMGRMQETMKMYGLELFDLGTTFNTNGILYPFAAYGIPFGIIYAIGLFSFPKLYKIKKGSYLLFVGFIVLLFVGERLMSPMPYILMFYGYKNILEFSN